MGKRRSEGGGGFINLYCMSSCSPRPIIVLVLFLYPRLTTLFPLSLLGLGAKGGGGGWPVVDTYLRCGHKRKNIFCQSCSWTDTGPIITYMASSSLLVQ